MKMQREIKIDHMKADHMKLDHLKLDLGSLRELYKSGAASPADVIAKIYDRIAAQPLAPVWIPVVPREKALARARKLERDPVGPVRPLYGVLEAGQSIIIFPEGTRGPERLPAPFKSGLYHLAQRFPTSSSSRSISTTCIAACRKGRFFRCR